MQTKSQNIFIVCVKKKHDTKKLLHKVNFVTIHFKYLLYLVTRDLNFNGRKNKLKRNKINFIDFHSYLVD